MKLHFKTLLSDMSVEHVLDLDTKEDFEEVVKTFPQLRESLYKYHDIRAIAKDMAEYLSSHHMHAWITE